MAAFIAIPVKKTDSVDFTGPIKQFVDSTYGTTDAPDIADALVELNKLRNSMIAKCHDKHESALEVVYRYYDQLCAVESKLPMTENQIRISFKWYDAFDKGSIFGSKKATIATSGYERACVLFNLAAMQSALAASKKSDDDAGLKAAAKLFQQSAGIFEFLKESVTSLVQQVPTPDLSVDVLAGLSALMLAQAQEAIYKKAAKDKMKDAIVAKVAQYLSDLYGEAAKLLQLHSLKSMFPDSWASTAAGKQAGFQGLAQLHQAAAAKANKCFGEQIARLMHARELLQSAGSKGSVHVNFTQHIDKAKRELEQAEKDNNFIYHEPIPPQRDLAAIGKAALAKPLPIAHPMSEGFKDLFANLVPLAVRQALAQFEARKSELLNREIGRMREATQTLNGVLASLNLPAAIEDGGSEVPPSLVEKAEQVVAQGGIGVIDKLMQELPDLLQRNKEIKDETYRMLDEEERSDSELREKFGDRWRRTASAQLTDPLRQEGSKYQAIIDQALSADKVVKDKYTSCANGLSILSQGAAHVKQALPASSDGGTQGSSAAVAELRSLMQQVDAIKAERDVNESELKSVDTSGITAQFVSALTESSFIEEERLSGEQLQKYSSLQQQVADSLQRQEQLLGKIQAAHSAFIAGRSGLSPRESLMKELAAAFDVYTELKANLEEGTKFYNDLTPMLLRFQSKVSDFCFARRTEKEDLMKELQSAIAHQPADQLPNTPSYQEDKKPPARPPPPRAAPAATAAAPSAPAPAAPAPPAAAAAPPATPTNPLPYPVQPYMPTPMPAGYYGTYPGSYVQQAPAPYPGYPPQGYPAQPPAGQPQGYPPQAYPPPAPGYPYPQQQWR